MKTLEKADILDGQFTSHVKAKVKATACVACTGPEETFWSCWLQKHHLSIENVSLCELWGHMCLLIYSDIESLVPLVLQVVSLWLWGVYML